jgi:4-oxalocrotonate tautomerase
MPEIYVYAVEGRTIEQKRQLTKEITEAVVRNFAVPPEYVVVQIVEAPRSAKARGGVLFSDQSPKP